MDLTNEFRVNAPIDRAWQVLTDLERIAPCMPGAQLQEVEGDEHRGIVKVKVGPITAQYKGVARIVDHDQDGGRLVLRAEGRETRGQGNASALITANLVAEGDGTHVTISTDLTITGKVAQFGRGVLADVSAKLLDQFVACLETDVLADVVDAAPGEAAAEAAVEAPVPSPSSTNSESAQVRRIDSAPSAPVDLMSTAGAPVAKRVAPIVALLFLATWLLRRRRKRRKG
jgi:carbon monoxide dehydrogenase subunit G